MKITAVFALFLSVVVTSGCSTGASSAISRDALARFHRPQASMFVERAEAPQRILARSLALKNSTL